MGRANLRRRRPHRGRTAVGAVDRRLFDEWVASGSDAVIVTARAEYLDESWLGRHAPAAEMLAGVRRLGVDPCGERGEYHTLVTNTPVVQHAAALATARATSCAPAAGRSTSSAKTCDRSPTALSFTYPRGERTVLRDVSLAPAARRGRRPARAERLRQDDAAPAAERHADAQTGEVAARRPPLAALTRRELARRIAVVPQETHATFDFTVLDIVLMGRYPHLGPFELEGAADLEIARDALGRPARATRDAAVRHAERRREAARRHRQRAGAGRRHPAARRADRLARSRLSARNRVAAPPPESRPRNDDGGVDARPELRGGAVRRRSCCCSEGGVLAQGATAETLTADNIRALYGVDADVQFHAARRSSDGGARLRRTS